MKWDTFQACFPDGFEGDLAPFFPQIDHREKGWLIPALMLGFPGLA
jgi:hypothetical protein